MKTDTSANFQQSSVLPWVELRVASQSTACYQPHSHDEFSFGIIHQGTAVYRNRQQAHQIGRGDIVTLNPADVHSCNPSAGTWSYSMLFVDALEMGRIQQEVLPCSRGDYQPFSQSLERRTQTQQRFNALFAALKADTNPLLVQSCFIDFIQQTFDPSEGAAVGASSPPPLQMVRERLLDNIEHSHQLDQLAAEVGLSRYQLLRAFKQQFGLPPHAFLIDEKIKRAKVLLKTGAEISQVALQLGFSDQSHFQRQFKQKLAVTPKFYQSHFQ